MKKQDDLPLHQAALLLALRDCEGTIAAGSSYHFALGGAIVAELLLRGHVRSETEGRKDFIVASGSRTAGDPLLDECLELVRRSSRRRTASHWASKFANLRKLKHRVAEELCEAGVLRAAESRVLGIFSRKIYPELDGGPERGLIERIRDAVLSDSAKIDPKTVVLIAIARHAGLLRAALSRSELRERKQRIDQIARGEIVDKAVKQAIAAMHAAVTTAAIIPAICAH